MNEVICNSDEEVTAKDCVSVTEVEAIVERMEQLTDDERAEIISHFCKYCGDIDPQCQCWNDE